MAFIQTFVNDQCNFITTASFGPEPARFEGDDDFQHRDNVIPFPYPVGFDYNSFLDDNHHDEFDGTMNEGSMDGSQNANEQAPGSHNRPLGDSLANDETGDHWDGTYGSPESRNVVETLHLIERPTEIYVTTSTQLESTSITSRNSTKVMDLQTRGLNQSTETSLEVPDRYQTSGVNFEHDAPRENP